MFDGPSDSRAVIFYPGAKVEAEAYAPLMYKIAEEWGDCFLVEMPANMAMLDADAAEDIQQEYHYDQWYLAGHSLGGVTAATYLQEHPEGFSGLILLAAYSTGQLSENLQVVSLYGDQDGVLNREEYEKNRNQLPDNTEERIIAGGNHAQFASYGAQKGDFMPEITPDEQQEKTADEIAVWAGLK
jgi:pimeloyl-ACP methyl ester carboxylesterase